MSMSGSVAERSRPLNRQRFEAIKDAEFRPAYDVVGLKYLRDKAGNERDMRELYRGRAPYELLQNADDAGATRALFVLLSDGLAFCHDGAWFTVDNFRSLADGWSDKDPGQCIGHKGLGFRSVLDITPAPYLVRLDGGEFFGVKFTWAMNRGHIQTAFNQDPSLREYYNSWTRYGQRACPVMAIPGLARRQNLGEGARLYGQLKRGSYGDGLTTMFWFPSTDPDIRQEALDELSPRPLTADGDSQRTLVDFIRGEVAGLLPFLASIESVRLYVGDERIASATAKREREGQRLEVISVHMSVGDSRSAETFFQMRSSFGIIRQIKRHADTPKAVKAMDQAEVVLSVRLDDGQPAFDNDSRFHVYFPTEEKAGLGFVVHGDFFVKPNRTQLMPGAYNEWLLAKAAELAAGPFLTHLLQRYEPRHVFEALSPQRYPATPSAERLVKLFSIALRDRSDPFIPTAEGMRRQENAVLPPTVDRDGFWEEHFSDVVSEVVGANVALVRHQVDGTGSRPFFDLAGLRVLDHEDFLGLIEAGSQFEQRASWWYDCYTYMATMDSRISSESPSLFVGRRLLPTSDSTVCAVPDAGYGPVVCLPPTQWTLRLPSLFSSVFVFLDAELARMLSEGNDSVRSWVLHRFSISQFEATDLLPRAVRTVNPDLFSGDREISPSELSDAWLFIQRVIALSRRSLESREFLRDVGRFPLPTEGAVSRGNRLEPEDLVPAFLSYWPEWFTSRDKSLIGVQNPWRIDAWFLGNLIAESGRAGSEWRRFLGALGVSSSPKLLSYSRLAVGGREIQFAPTALDELDLDRFSGERQRDENRAVAAVLAREEIWPSLVRSAKLCGHDVPKVLQSASVLEGFSACSQAAQREYESGDEAWKQRLEDLIRSLTKLGISSAAQEEDTVFCRGGSRGGHSVEIGSYLNEQLAHHKWLPSSLGPASSSHCFARLRSRHLISSGRWEDELGDLLIPYVVVGSIDELAELQRLGVEALEDADSATCEALIRALDILGKRLSTEWGRQEILSRSSRWRLVRGAIQQIYQSLNRREARVDYPQDLPLAKRSREIPAFVQLPLYYADPGSAIEQAFFEVLPLIDTDRPYPNLFEQLGVISLVSGDTVNEEFVSDADATPATQLRTEIVERLSPYLLAAITAKGDSTQVDTVRRRLEHRFEVKATQHLAVSYSLARDPGTEQRVEFPNFYLQRQLREGPGAIREAHFTLYVAGDASMSFFDHRLDPDALGVELAQVVMDDMSEALAGLFPRITSRYYYHDGDQEEMSEYLYRQIGISESAQDMARATLAGETHEERDTIASPPPIIVHYPTGDDETEDDDTTDAIDKAKQETRDKLEEQWEGFGKSVDQEKDDTAAADSQVEIPSDIHPARPAGPTKEQQRRGRRGEGEIKTRLSLPGGWAGFTLLSDRREAGCGYDFLCESSDRQVKLEVKTFTRNGYVVVTNSELRSAASNRGDYFLIGILAEEEQEPAEWATFIIPDPISVLLKRGDIRLETEVRAPAIDLFGFEEQE
jgi:hypothetical protein